MSSQKWSAKAKEEEMGRLWWSATTMIEHFYKWKWVDTWIIFRLLCSIHNSFSVHHTLFSAVNIRLCSLYGRLFMSPFVIHITGHLNKIKVVQLYNSGNQM